MKNIIMAFFALSQIAISAQQKFKMEVELKYTPPDCNKTASANSGGEVPLASTRFYVYQGKICIDSVKTDPNGKLILKLSEGTYYLFESWKHFKRTPDGSPLTDFFTDCLKKEWASPNYQLTIKKDGDINMTYYYVSAARCPNQYACLKVRHLPKEIKRQ